MVAQPCEPPCNLYDIRLPPSLSVLSPGVEHGREKKKTKRRWPGPCPGGCKLPGSSLFASCHLNSTTKSSADFQKRRVSPPSGMKKRNSRHTHTPPVLPAWTVCAQAACAVTSTSGTSPRRSCRTGRPTGPLAFLLPHAWKITRSALHLWPRPETHAHTHTLLNSLRSPTINPQRPPDDHDHRRVQIGGRGHLLPSCHACSGGTNERYLPSSFPSPSTSTHAPARRLAILICDQVCMHPGHPPRSRAHSRGLTEPGTRSDRRDPPAGSVLGATLACAVCSMPTIFGSARSGSAVVMGTLSCIPTARDLPTPSASSVQRPSCLTSSRHDPSQPWPTPPGAREHTQLVARRPVSLFPGLLRSPSTMWWRRPQLRSVHATRANMPRRWKARCRMKLCLDGRKVNLGTCPLLGCPPSQDSPSVPSSEGGRRGLRNASRRDRDKSSGTAASRTSSSKDPALAPDRAVPRLLPPLRVFSFSPSLGLSACMLAGGWMAREGANSPRLQDCRRSWPLPRTPVSLQTTDHISLRRWSRHVCDSVIARKLRWIGAGVRCQGLVLCSAFFFHNQFTPPSHLQPHRLIAK